MVKLSELMMKFLDNMDEHNKKLDEVLERLTDLKKYNIAYFN